MYKKITDESGDIISVLRLKDNAQIPINDENSDYQKFKLWLLQESSAIYLLEEAFPETPEQKAAKEMPGDKEKMDAVFDVIANNEYTKLDSVKLKIKQVKDKYKVI